MKCKIYLSLLLLFLVVIPAYSAEKIRIVVLNLKADGVSDRTARTVTNMLRTEFINIGRFTVVERAQMDAILEEQGLQQTGCTDQECAVQIGKLMSAKKIMVGEVSPMGSTIIMTIRIVDVEKGVSEFAASQKADSEDVLDVAVARIAKSITARIEGEEEPVYVERPREKEKVRVERKPAEKTMTGYYMRGFVPGWGQLYAGKTVKGIVFLGTFAAGSLLTVLAIINYNNAKRDYEELGEDATEKDFGEAFDKYEKAGPNIGIFAGVTLGVYVLNWLDILFLSKPNYAAKDGTINYNRNFYTFNVDMPSRYSNNTKFNFGVGLRF
jgi:TolB-like protein